MRILKVLASIIIIVSLSYCTDREHKTNVISVSIPPLKYIVDSIVCGDYEVTSVVTQEQSPETFEISISQLSNLYSSKFYLSLGLMPFEVYTLKKMLSEKGVPIIDLSNSVNLLDGSCCNNSSHSHSNSTTVSGFTGGVEENCSEDNNTDKLGKDPHIWLDLVNLQKIAKVVLDKLCDINPDKKEFYTENYNRLSKRLGELNVLGDSLLGNSTKKTFLIYHPALTYLAQRYNLEQLSFEKDGKEPTLKHLAYVRERIAKDSLSTIFFQTQFNKTLVENISSNTGASLESFSPLAYDVVVNLETLIKKLNIEFTH